MQPGVRDLQALIAEQTAALQPQFGLIDADITSNTNAGAAQEQGLTATKDKTFKQIGQASQNKGMFFSGFTPNEEADYTASTYLPALAQLQATIAQTRSNLLGKKAELGKSAFDTAFKTREEDKAVVNRWNEMTAQQQFQASQAEKDRAFQAQQNLLKIQSDERQGAANRSASSKASAGPSAASNAAAGLRAYVGDDGYVSPGTYASVKAQWVGSGDGTAAQFDKQFAGFKNPNNKNYR